LKLGEGEPVDVDECAVSVVVLVAEVSSEDDADELDDPAIRVGAESRRWVAEAGDKVGEFDFPAELLGEFSRAQSGKSNS